MVHTSTSTGASKTDLTSKALMIAFFTNRGVTGIFIMGVGEALAFHYVWIIAQW